MCRLLDRGNISKESRIWGDYRQPVSMIPKHLWATKLTRIFCWWEPSMWSLMYFYTRLCLVPLRCLALPLLLFQSSSADIIQHAIGTPDEKRFCADAENTDGKVEESMRPVGGRGCWAACVGSAAGEGYLCKNRGDIVRGRRMDESFET